MGRRAGAAAHDCATTLGPGVDSIRRKGRSGPTESAGRFPPASGTAQPGGGGTDACASAFGSHLRSSEGVWNGVSTRYTNGAIASEDWPCGNMSPESRAGRLSDSQIRPDTGLLQEHVSCARSASEPGNGVPLRVTGGPVRELHAPQVQRHPAYVARASAAIQFPDPRRPERCLGEGSSCRYRGRSDGHRGM